MPGGKEGDLKDCALLCTLQERATATSDARHGRVRSTRDSRSPWLLIRHARCGTCEADQVELTGDVWLRSEDHFTELGSLEVCGDCLRALAGLARLEGTRGKLLMLELMC